jgi:hypothetical protein
MCLYGVTSGKKNKGAIHTKTHAAMEIGEAEKPQNARCQPSSLPTGSFRLHRWCCLRPCRGGLLVLRCTRGGLLVLRCDNGCKAGWRRCMLPNGCWRACRNNPLERHGSCGSGPGSCNPSHFHLEVEVLNISS